MLAGKVKAFQNHLDKVNQQMKTFVSGDTDFQEAFDKNQR